MFWKKPKPQPAPPPAPSRRTESRPDGTLYAVAGFSRSGKSSWVAQQVAGARRLLVWDYPKGEWAARYRCRKVTTFEELAEFCKAGSKPERVAFMRVSENPDKDFKTWAKLAWVYVCAHGGPVVAEELSEVTHPGKAPGAWGSVCRMALGKGSDIYAITQRPAESDKTSFGNAAVIHCGLMGTLDDRRTMSKYLDVPLPRVEALRQFQWLERDRRTGKLTAGVTRKMRK